MAAVVDASSRCAWTLHGAGVTPAQRRRRQRCRPPVRAFGNCGKKNGIGRHERPCARANASPPDGEGCDPEGGALPPHFDLDTSILLAGFAFESYLSPEGGLLDTDVRGGSTSYLSPFVREVFAGVIEATVVKCEGLPKADVVGLSDPYCVLSTGGGSSYRTKTKRLTLNPKWREEEATARLYVRRTPRDQVLTIRVLDEDLLESDDLLGVVHVPLKDLVAKAATPLGQMFAQTEQMTLGLPAGSGAPGGGAVTVKMKYLPFNPPVQEMFSKGLKKAAKEMDKSSRMEDFDSRLKLAAKAAGAAAGAVAGGLDFISKEAARREFESALWAVKPDGDWQGFPRSEIIFTFFSLLFSSCKVIFNRLNSTRLSATRTVLG